MFSVNMKYSTDNLPRNAVRFETESGTARDLYATLVGKLDIFYRNQGLKLSSPPAPDFEQYNFGQTDLNPHTVFMPRKRKEPLNIGKVGMAYFRAGMQGRPRQNIDYPVGAKGFSHTQDQTTYEALTIFFNTFHSKTVQESIGSQITKKQRTELDKSDEELREAERDVFLIKLEELL